MSNVKQVIVVRKDLKMRTGKLAAQVAHASMKFLIDNNTSDRANVLRVELSSNEADWINNSFTKIVVGVDSEEELKNLIFKANLNNIEVHEIIDNGLTEFHNVPTLTCAAFGPDKSEIIDEITKNLKLM